MMIDFDPSEWLNEQRFQSLQKQLSPGLELLHYSGCLDKVLIMWVRREVIGNFKVSNPVVGNDKDEGEILNLWCLEQWEARLKELFLEKKDQLDLVSFRLMTIENNGVALEVYHRLKEKEASFDLLANKFGVLSDKNKDPLKKNKRMGSLPLDLQQKIRIMNQGDLSKPLKSNRGFLLIKLEQFEDAKFTQDLQDKILMDQFSSWATNVVKVIRHRLGLNDM